MISNEVPCIVSRRQSRCEQSESSKSERDGNCRQGSHCITSEFYLGPTQIESVPVPVNVLCTISFGVLKGLGVCK